MIRPSPSTENITSSFDKRRTLPSSSVISATTMMKSLPSAVNAFAQTIDAQTYLCGTARGHFFSEQTTLPSFDASASNVTCRQSRSCNYSRGLAESSKVPEYHWRIGYLAINVGYRQGLHLVAAKHCGRTLSQLENTVTLESERSHAVGNEYRRTAITGLTAENISKAILLRTKRIADAAEIRVGMITALMVERVPLASADKLTLRMEHQP